MGHAGARGRRSKASMAPARSASVDSLMPCRDVILVGHSYAGTVSTGVAERAPDPLRHIVYLDAFVPEVGESAHDIVASVWRSMVRLDVNHQQRSGPNYSDR
jgi:pimeloyl-ACP methyl ester carboxylesterase